MSANESIARARLALASGRALFREGIVAECHAYMRLALHSLLDAWAPVTDAESAAGAPSEQREQALLTIERAQYRHIARLSAAYRSVGADAPPATPAIEPRERDLDWVWSEVDRLLRFTVRHFTPQEARKQFRLRLLLVGVPLLLALGLFLGLQRGRPNVVASATYGEPFPPEHAVDGLEATEWLLPSGTLGWLDLSFKSPRSVHKVTLVNCHNGGFGDRSSGKVRVTAFANDTVLSSVDGAFTALSTEHSALDLALKAEGVTRVRAEVLSTFGRGGGFAEVEVR